MSINNIILSLRQDYMETQEYKDLMDVMERYSHDEVVKKVHLGFKCFVKKNEGLNDWPSIRRDIMRLF